MHVRVNGVRLFFDVEGAGLVPDGPAMREKPTLLMLHGGPGAGLTARHRRFFDPAHYRIVLFDQRGAGGSCMIGAGAAICGS